MTSPATFLSALSDVGMRLNRKPKADKDEKDGGTTVTRYRALATVRVQKGHIRVHRDTCTAFLFSSPAQCIPKVMVLVFRVHYGT